VYSAGAEMGVSWIMIKAICDWGFEKQDGDQGRAARNAAEFAMHVVRAGGLSLRVARR
jgi:hypothetical protein